MVSSDYGMPALYMATLIAGRITQIAGNGFEWGLTGAGVGRTDYFS